MPDALFSWQIKNEAFGLDLVISKGISDIFVISKQKDDKFQNFRFFRDEVNQFCYYAVAGNLPTDDYMISYQSNGIKRKFTDEQVALQKAGANLKLLSLMNQNNKQK